MAGEEEQAAERAKEREEAGRAAEEQKLAVRPPQERLGPGEGGKPYKVLRINLVIVGN